MNLRSGDKCVETDQIIIKTQQAMNMRSMLCDTIINDWTKYGQPMLYYYGQINIIAQTCMCYCIVSRHKSGTIKVKYLKIKVDLYFIHLNIAKILVTRIPEA